MFTGLGEFCPDIQKRATFLDVDESVNCRFAVEFSSLSSQEHELMENKFGGKFVNLRQSLFLLHAEQSAIVSQVLYIFTGKVIYF
jgi:hypothetical protein